MNTCNSSDLRGAYPLRLFSAIAFLLICSIPLLGAGRPVADSGKSAKPYKLFVGANLTVEWHGKLWPVRGVQRNAFVIDADGKPVRMGGTDLRMKIGTALKMTTAYATVADVKAERAYTAANDPRHYARDATLVASEASDASDMALAGLNTMMHVRGLELEVVNTWRDPVPPPQPQFSATDIANASQAYQQSLGPQGSEISSVPDAMEREQVALSQKLFDAFSLSFKISAAKRLENPYLVVLVRFRNKADKPKMTRLLVYAQVLPSIDQRPQTVRLFRGGFPLGYQLVDYQIHLYEHGTEIATSAAPNEMAMTTDEAFRYSLVDYVVRNRDKTLPPAPDRAFWPKDISARLPAGKLNRPLYVKIGKDGAVAGFYDDKGCTRPIRDAELDALRPDLRFQPALEKGNPVEGVVEFSLGRRAE